MFITLFSLSGLVLSLKSIPHNICISVLPGRLIDQKLRRLTLPTSDCEAKETFIVLNYWDLGIYLLSIA
jgi:hypothetical protein